ncbi:uncharacterized protein LOC129559345 isoform X3 [Moschus berezovskii]|uniref:uncharacterized protein LOC129559345 isoform X3 n=1 Tax=Moschus berezovskii TaxID=68408 RepID=UPI0024450CD9|nr:uncharacterized protein LOC129559345 isoform X3 [Moschus berezovskii]
MECGEAMGTGAALGQGPSAPAALTDNPQARLTVVVEVEGTRSGPKETCFPMLLLEGAKSIRLLQPGPLDSQEQCITFDRVLGSDAAQEAEQELLAQIRPTLGSVGRGYSVALLLRGREMEAPRLVPQLLQMLFEQALPLKGSDAVLSTLSLVQLSASGRIRDLLTPGAGNLSVLDVAPLGLVVENASEVEVSDSRAASELYLQAACGGGSCSLLTVTMSCLGPGPPEGLGTQRMWRGALRILQLPGEVDCPLLQVLAGNVAGEEVEGSLTWIVSWLLEGNNYSGLLLRLDPQGSPLSLFQSALLGAAGRRRKVKHVRPTLWDAVEEARARRAGLKSLRSGLLGDALTDSGLSQLGRSLRELHVVKAWSQLWGSWMLKAVKTEAVGLPEPQLHFMDKKTEAQKTNHLLQQVTHSTASPSPGIQKEPQVAGRTASIGPDLHQMHPLRDSEEQAQQAPDVALYFLLAQAQRHRLREQHQAWIQEELKRMEQEEEVVAGDQVKGLVAEEDSKERQRWQREQTMLRCQLEALQAERDAAEQDLTALYDLHVQAARAQTCHVLQVFRAWRGLCEEQAMTTEHHYRSLLAGILQDSISLATQNQELQAQNKQLRQTGLAAVVLDTCPEEKPGDQESNRGFSRQEYCSSLPFPPPGIFSIQGSNPNLWRLLHWNLYH